MGIGTLERFIRSIEGKVVSIALEYKDYKSLTDSLDNDSLVSSGKKFRELKEAGGGRGKNYYFGGKFVNIRSL